MNHTYLSKREQQIMEAMHEHESVTAAQLEALLPGQPTNAAIRTHLRILERKGHVNHVEIDGRYVYSATHSKDSEGRSALDRLTKTFFSGSITGVVSTLLDSRKDKLTLAELNELEALIRSAKEEGR
jgi:predicted transcriptional regulator